MKDEIKPIMRGYLSLSQEERLEFIKEVRGFGQLTPNQQLLYETKLTIQVETAIKARLGPLAGKKCGCCGRG